MFAGITTVAAQAIRHWYPESSHEMRSGQVIVFSFFFQDEEKLATLGLGSTYLEQVVNCPMMTVGDLRLYFDVPKNIVSSWTGNFLHYNIVTKEFEAVDVILSSLQDAP